MGSTNASIISQLLSRVPDFHPDEDDVREGLTYPIINDLGRYICEKSRSGEEEAVKKAVDWLEQLLVGRDESVLLLVGDCLWGLLDCPQASEISAFFGPHLRKLYAKYPPV